MEKKPSSSSPTGLARTDVSHTVPLGLVPPQNIEAELAILGAMLLNEKQIPVAIARLGGPGQGSKFFYKTSHADLYDVTAKLYTDGTPVNAVTIENALGDRFERVGGAAYLACVVEGCIAFEVDPYLDIIIRKRRERVRLVTAQRIINSCQQLNEMGEFEHDFLAETDEFIRDDIFGDEEIHTRGIKQICSDVISEWGARIESGGLLGKPSHLPRLDALTGGWVGGRLIVLAARPAVGKTSLGLEFCDYLAKSKDRVCFVSLEMQDSDLIGRVICQRANINYGMLQTDPKKFSADADWEKITNTFTDLSGSGWVVNDRAALDVYQICTIIENAHNEAPLALACVDYLQLFGGMEDQFLVQATARACAVLRGCAKRLGIPIILISQLSRNVENRKGDKRPIPSDLRDSGGIEQVADLIIFIYRDVMYNRNLTTERARSVAEINVAKNRHGPCGTVYCFFNAATTRFIADDYEFAELVLAGEYSAVDAQTLARNRLIEAHFDGDGNIVPGTVEIIGTRGAAAGTLTREAPYIDPGEEDEEEDFPI